MNQQNLAVLFDFKEEGWLSMDFCAEMLLSQLQHNASHRFRSEPILPSYQRLLTGLPWLGKKRPIRAVDETVNRFWVYPQALHRQKERFAYFHICRSEEHTSELQSR